MQHAPVYTLGSGSSLQHLGFSPEAPPFPLFRTERGGEVTYHGPGQLVAYPIINLRHFTQDLHWYLRGLEETIIRWACYLVAAHLLLQQMDLQRSSHCAQSDLPSRKCVFLRGLMSMQVSG